MSTPRAQTLKGLLVLAILFILTGLLIVLEQPSGSVEGLVLGEDGKPLAGAEVVLEAYPFEYKGATDEAGVFRIAQVPVGKYYPRIYKKGYERAYLPEQFVEEGKTFHLSPRTLQPLPPRLYVDIWDTTKMPGEKVGLSVNGAKIPKINFSVYSIDLVAFSKAELKISDLAADTALPPYFQNQKPIAEWEYTIPEANVAEFDLKIPLKKEEQPWAFETGFYLIHGEAGSVDRSKVFITHTLLNRTDLGFILKQGQEKFLILTSKLSDAQPVTGATLHFFPEAGEPLETQSDEMGLARLDTSTAADFQTGSVFVVATSPQGIAYTYAPGDLSGGESGEGTPLDGEAADEDEAVFTMVYSDRPLYRPGQRVFLKGLARQRNGAGTYDQTTPETVRATVEDPRGNIFAEQEVEMESDGSFSASVMLPEEAELGYYTVRSEVKGREYIYNFEVDEYRKPEFKIDITGAKPQYFAGDEITFLIDAQYFFGAPVEAEMEWFLYRSAYFYMPPGEGYLEDYYAQWSATEEGGIGGYGEYMAEGKIKTDAQGHATVTYQTKEGTEDYRYSILLNARDVSDQQIQREGSLVVTAGDFYFRTERREFLAMPKQPYSLTVLSHSYQDQPVSRDYKVEVKRQYWDGIAKQYDYKKVETVKGKTDEKGRGESKITLPRGGYYQLEISGKDSSGRKVEFTDYLWVSGSGEDSEDFGIAKEVKIIPEKKRYGAGETAKLFVVGPDRGGRVLLTVEGRDLYQSQIVTLDGFSKEVQLPLAKEWIPNVFIQAVAMGKKDYYFGETELSLSPDAHYLKVTVQTDKEKYQPGEQITYRVATQDAQGQPVPAAFSLGVVDEKIYALRADKTDIKKFFWGPRPNHVGTAYSFSGYYSGGIAKEDRNLLRRNFKDTAFWAARLETDDQGQAQMSFTLPDNLTTWRATVIASTLTTSVGQQTQQVIATKPLIARLATPRFFTEKDVVQLKAIVHNYTDAEQTLQVSLGLEGLNFVNAGDDQARSLTIPPKEVRSFTYPVLAKNPGTGKVQLLAKNAQVSDGVELAIPILPYGIADRQFAQGEIAAGLPGQAARQGVAMALPPDSAPDRSSLLVTLDASFVGQLLGPLDYLVEYPYGCVEQTMSRLLPALQVATLAKELGLSDANLEKKIPRVIERGLMRIARMQNAQGGWGWWSNDSTDPFMTAYALYGLVQAKRLGQKVETQTIEQGKAALGELLKNGADPSGSYLLGTEGTRYFIHYAAALAGVEQNIPIPRAQPLQSPLAQSLLALTLLEQNRTTDAQSILQGLEQGALCEQGKCHFVEKEQYYDRSLIASAWALKALVQSQSGNIFLKDGLARWLMEQRQGGRWRQTLETATALYALAAYARDLPGAMEGVQADLQWNGKELETIAVASPHFVRRFQGCVPDQKECQGAKKLPLSVGKQELSISNPRENPLYYQTEFIAWSKAEKLSAVDQGIRIKREYFILEGKNGDRYKAKDLKGEIKKGNLVGVRITLETNRDLHYLMIEDPLPSGFEAVDGITFDEQTAYATDKSVRDEKITFFRTELKAGTHILNYGLLPELAGDFYVLPTVASEMYQPEIRGSAAGDKLAVRE